MSVTDSNTQTTIGKKRGPKPRKLSKSAPVYTVEQIEGFAEDLLSMAEKGQIQIFEDFYKKHRLHRGLWKEWCEKYDYLKYIHRVAKEAMASTGFDKFPECPTRGTLLMKTQHGWTDIEEIADNVAKVNSFQQLKALLKDGKD